MADKWRKAVPLEVTERLSNPMLLATHTALALRGKLPWSST